MMGLHRVLGVDLNLVEAVLDGLDGHGVSLDYFIISYSTAETVGQTIMICFGHLASNVQLVYQSDAISTSCLPQVVDANSPTFPLVL